MPVSLSRHQVGSNCLGESQREREAGKNRRTKAKLANVERRSVREGEGRRENEMQGPRRGIR